MDDRMLSKGLIQSGVLITHDNKTFPLLIKLFTDISLTTEDKRKLLTNIVCILYEKEYDEIFDSVKITKENDFYEVISFEFILGGKRRELEFTKITMGNKLKI